MPSRPLPLIDPQELARRNNESSALARKRRLRTKSRLLNKILDEKDLSARPVRAVGFFLPEPSKRKIGYHKGNR
jgi:hypothetical protein